MPNSFHWWQEMFGSTSEYNNATNYIFKKSSSKCSFFYVGTVFTNMPSCFLESSFCGSKSENKLDFFWKENFSAECSSAHKKCNFNNAAKKLDKKSKAFRSIFENNYIKNQFSQETHFMRKRLQSYRLLTWQPCRKNIPSNLKSFLLEKKWEKRVYWDNFFIERFPWTRRKQKRHSC